MAKHRAEPRVPPWVMWAIGVAIVAVAAFAWASHLSDRGEIVAARVTLGEQDLGGTPLNEIQPIVEQHAAELLERDVVIEFGVHELRATYADLGFQYSVPDTVRSIANARRNGGVILQFASWATIPVAEKRAEVSWSFERTKAEEFLAAIDRLTPIQPTEPSISTNTRGALVVTPGQPGTTVDIDHLVLTLGEIDLPAPAVEIEARLIPIEPTVSDEAAEEVAQELTEATNTGVQVSLRGQTARVSAERLRSNLVFAIGDGQIVAEMDVAGLQQGLEDLFPAPVLPFEKPTVEVVDGEVRVVEPGRTPQVCCAPGAATLIAEVVLGDGIESYRSLQLDPRGENDPVLQTWADGSAVQRQVSSFTTNHPCCENRVKNIQRMADLVAGAYLLPGESLSLNDHVGRRTRENGFVAAGAIRSGHLTDEVGGGVSQFATTMFNAAYFAGLDFDEYRSHTIYFSRYPYGREATISMPGPDLVLNNTTHYPVLISTSYTDTSITVSMYSTPHIEVEEIDQRVGRWGACTHVETDRQRTYPDGAIVVDTFEATYRPAEGIDCSGNPTPQPTD